LRLVHAGFGLPSLAGDNRRLRSGLSATMTRTFLSFTFSSSPPFSTYSADDNNQQRILFAQAPFSKPALGDPSHCLSSFLPSDLTMGIPHIPWYSSWRGARVLSWWKRCGQWSFFHSSKIRSPPAVPVRGHDRLSMCERLQHPACTGKASFSPRFRAGLFRRSKHGCRGTCSPLYVVKCCVMISLFPPLRCGFFFPLTHH